MKCPHCGEMVKVPDCVLGNIRAYDSTPTIAANCCGKAIRVFSHIVYEVSPVYAEAGEDNWGDTTVSSL